MSNKIFNFRKGDKRNKLIEIYLEFAEYLYSSGILSVLQAGNLSGEDLSLVLGTKATKPNNPNQQLEAGKIYLGHRPLDDWESDTNLRDRWKVFYVNPIDWKNISKYSNDLGVFYIDLNRLQEWQGEDKGGKDFFKSYGGWQRASDEIGLVTSGGGSKTLFGDWTFWEFPSYKPLGLFNWTW